jgi:hypothetical protein
MTIRLDPADAGSSYVLFPHQMIRLSLVAGSHALRSSD